MAGRDFRWRIFLNNELGQLWQSIPFDELAALFPKHSGLGAPAFFDIKGGIALQVLKAYFNGMSDDKLRQRINTDWELQYFCGIRLGPGQKINDEDIVGRWRRYIAERIDYEEFQATLAQHWSPFIKQKTASLCDATVYESNLRYPTDVKLLWECIDWLWQLIDEHIARLGLKKVRRKQKQVYEAYLAYQKLKRKPKKRRRSITRRLLNLLEKGLGKWINMVKYHEIILTEKQYRRLDNIRTVHQQQVLHFAEPEAKIHNRIVSLAKDYIRPIIRGKEIKRTEFGAKVHTFMVDGISFVEHFSYNAFHEGNGLENTIEKHREYFGSCKAIGADRIYATNANRRYCGIHHITTNFVPKGRKPKPTAANKEKQAIRKALAKARATHMEGSFGNEKQHYSLKTIKARRADTEKLWIHIGIWTASAMKVGRRMHKQKQKAEQERQSNLSRAA